LRSRDRQETTATVLRVTHLHRAEGRVEVSGKVRLTVTGTLRGLHVGDEVEVVGRLARLAGPANPGEFDVAGYWRDQGVRAQVVVSKTPAGLTRLQRRWPVTFAGWLAVVRGWGQDLLARTLPESTRNVAMALLLGEGSPMTSSE